MDIFTFAITIIVSFIGILFGAILTHHTKDEILSIKQNLPTIQFSILVIVFLVMFFYFPFMIALALLVLSFGFTYFFWKKNVYNFLDYIVLAMVLVISSTNPQAHMYITLLSFIFGIFSGSLFYIMHTNHKKHRIKKLAHHKHSGKDLTLSGVSHYLYKLYRFFFFLALVAFAFAHIFDLYFL
jgi:hypothetical protein